MKAWQKVLGEPSVRTIRRLSALSLVLMLGLTAHGLWLLLATALAQGQRDARFTAAALAAEADLIFDLAAATLTAAPVLPPLAPSPGGQAAPTAGTRGALGPRGYIVYSAMGVPATADGTALARLTASPMYPVGHGPAALNLGRALRPDGSWAYFVWQEMTSPPQRVAVVLPDALFADMARRWNDGLADGFAPAQVALVPSAASAADLADRGVLGERALSRVPLTARVHLPYVAVLAGLGRQTGPLLPTVFFGTGLLLLALLALAHVAVRQERQQQELGEARTLTRGAHRSRRALLAAVSHELSLPLGGLVGVAQLLPTDALKPDARRLVAVLLLTARTLQSVVRDIVERARRPVTGCAPCAAPVSPWAIGTEVTDLFYASAVAKGIELTFVSPASAGLVHVDAFDLRQVLANLVGNAVKFTHRGNVVLSCSASAAEGTPGCLRLRYEVRDSGCGIAPENLRALLTPGVPLASASASAPARAGVGLALARHLVRTLGGELEVESRVGQGTRVWFELTVPLAASAPPQSAAAMPPQGAAPAPCGGARLLLVEDNPVSAAVTEAHLRSHGYCCDVASDGESALAAMVLGGYDLVFMDCTLPGLSGRDVTKAWREFERRGGAAPLPIVALTARDADAHAQACMSAGMSGFLTKPCSADTLAATVATWLHRPAAQCTA